MQLMKLLHKTLQKELPFIHKARLNNLILACSTAVGTNQLTLTGLGRDIQNKNQVNSNIQKMDRLLGNIHLQNEKNQCYKLMIGYLIKPNSTPWLHVDWSCLNSTTNLYVLRASLSMSSRSIVIFETCHTKKEDNNHVTHKAFLNQLKQLLPTGVKPIIVTDAGFRAPWFSHILKLGWDFVGRLRNRNLLKLDAEAHWRFNVSLLPVASGTPVHMGPGTLTRERRVPAQFIVYKGQRKGRHKLNQPGKQSLSGHSKKYGRSHTEPWVLVTSMTSERSMASKVVQIYKQRMRIEKNFRDTKSPHYGLGLKKSLSRSPERVAILLLIAALATFAAWLAGLYTTYIGKASAFQAHSARFTSALSKVYLGRQALKRGFKITIKQFHLMLEMLYHLS